MRSRDREIRDRLLSWFKAQDRKLPWRGSRDPYSIWVSEVMLQQTTVGAVLPRFGPFLDRFPDLETLARASEESVVAEWSGLGYYARARNLHRAARQIVKSHGGRMPREPDELRELPGFGEYMAAAVASLAFGVRAPAADANVTRILSRLHAIPGSPASQAHRRRIREAAAALLPEANPGDATAALMDLGQSICLPRRPRCGICPLTADCAGLATGAPERFPEKPASPPVERVFYAAAAARRRGRTWLVRRPAGTWLAGMWVYPAAEGTTAAAARRALAANLEASGFAVTSGPALGQARHTIMRRRYVIAVYAAEPPSRSSSGARTRVRIPTETRWFTPAELDSGAVSTLTRKIARAAGFLPPAN
jgi:A/G-specific adenine glycosylase